MKNLRWVPQATAAAVLTHAARTLGDRALLMPLKGVLLGRTHYDDLADRPLSDCDLLVVEPNFRVAVRRLRAAGYIVVPGSRTEDVVTFRTPITPTMSLDLHARPLPPGIGRITTPWMFQDAIRDTTMFGVPVWIPDERRLFTHVVGNIAKDHVFRPFPHTYEDVRRLLARRSHRIEEFASVLADARLRHTAWVVLNCVLEQRPTADIGALLHGLALSPIERRHASWRLEYLRRHASAEAPAWMARIVARMASDSVRDDVVGLAHALRGTALEWLQRSKVRS